MDDSTDGLMARVFYESHRYFGLFTFCLPNMFKLIPSLSLSVIDFVITDWPLGTSQRLFCFACDEIVYQLIVRRIRRHYFYYYHHLNAGGLKQYVIS